MIEKSKRWMSMKVSKLLEEWSEKICTHNLNKNYSHQRLGGIHPHPQDDKRNCSVDSLFQFCMVKAINGTGG